MMMVSAPARMDKKTLELMIEERLPWAERRLAKLAADYQRLGLPKGFVGGELFPYLGRHYPLTLIVAGNSRQPKCFLAEDRFIIEIRDRDEDKQRDTIKKALLKWYRSQAEKDLINSVNRWAPFVGQASVFAQIRNQKTRWGSCSRTGKISLNWRLVMLPPEVLAYVVVHELCHLIEPNHSPRFWAVVAKAIPHYKQRRTLLRRHSAYLDAF